MFPTPRQLTALFFLSCITASAYLRADIVAGPMLGHIDMREATIWVQTDAPAKVRVAYAEQGQADALRWSDAIQTSNALNNTATLTLNAVEPG